MTLFWTVVTAATVMLGIETVYWALTRRARFTWLPRRRSSPLVTAVVVATVIAVAWPLDASGVLEPLVGTSVTRGLFVALVVALEIATVFAVGLLLGRRTGSEPAALGPGQRSVARAILGGALIVLLVAAAIDPPTTPDSAAGILLGLLPFIVGAGLVALLLRSRRRR